MRGRPDGHTYHGSDRYLYNNDEELRDRSLRGEGGYRPGARANEPARPSSPPRGPRRDRPGAGPSRRWDSPDSRDYRRPDDEANYHMSRRAAQYRDLGATSGDSRDDDFYAQKPRSNHRRRDEPLSYHDSAESPLSEAEPTREIIVDRLPSEVQEEDVRADLVATYNVRNLGNIRIIRDKKTGQSRGFGFVSFETVEDAAAFMRDHGPEIPLHYQRATDGLRAECLLRLDFSRERPDRAENDWMCNCMELNFGFRTECYKCRAPKSDSVARQRSPFEKLDGWGHASEKAECPLLVIVDLRPNINETLLANGVSKLLRTPTAIAGQGAPTGPSKLMSTATVRTRGAKEGSLHRVFLICDRETGESWRYGFAEFFTIEDAKAAMAKYESIPDFTIGSQPVQIRFAYPSAFVPAPNSTPNDHFSFPALHNKDKRLKYYHPPAFAKEKMVKEGPEDVFVPAMPTTASSTTAGAVSTAGPIPTGALKVNLKPSARKRKAENEDGTPAKKVIMSSQSVEMVTGFDVQSKINDHLEQWKNRHALHSEDDDNHSDKPSSAIEKDPSYTDTSKPGLFLDEEEKCCMLCRRKFKTLEKLLEHERDSELHRENLKNDALKEAALKKLGRTASPAELPSQSANPQYHDRAKARRQAEKEERRSELAASKKPSMGAALLGKMGWSEGEALGARGTGITAPIETNLYAAGVGLGAQGGWIGNAAEEANKNTKDNNRAYIERAKDKARERYFGSN